MTTATPTGQFTTCTTPSCYGLRIAGMPLRCPNCGDTLLLYPRKPARKRALLRQLPCGTVEALSSDGGTVYELHNSPTDGWSCPGFTHHGHCYHATTAAQRFAGFVRRPADGSATDPEPEPPAPATLYTVYPGPVFVPVLAEVA